MRITRVIRSVALLGIALLFVTGVAAQEEAASSVTAEQGSAGSQADGEPEIDAQAASGVKAATAAAEDSVPEGQDDEAADDEAADEEEAEGASDNPGDAPEVECDCEAAVNSAIDEAREDFARLDDELVNVKTDRSNLHAENLELKAREIRLSSEVTARVATMERQANEISALKASLERSQNRIAELTAEVQELLERVAAFKPQVSIIAQIGKLVKRFIVEAKDFIGRKL
jgi:predicted RNase H-like nuclease (RuvC/YqgF family)